jgi:hypothetical protein
VWKPQLLLWDILIKLGNPDVSPNNTLLASESVVYRGSQIVVLSSLPGHVLLLVLHD